MSPFGLYIHIPFCASKCIYCDFFSANVSIAQWQSYVSALVGEYKSRRHEASGYPDTIYIGGGTPSLLPEDSLKYLIAAIRGVENRDLTLSEFTLEVNPEDVTEKMCKVWKDAGINRISMGVQSFVDSELSRINRRHSSQKAIEAFSVLRNRFSNISIDLMFGLPGQTTDSWMHTVNQALRLDPDHISAYSLMFEEKTPITILRDKGKMQFPEENESVWMFEYLSDTLKNNGFIQYEISNYSKEGRESIHNRRYWTGVPYIGLGPSAHSFDGDNIRRSNTLDIRNYIDYYSDNVRNLVKSDIMSEETLDEEEKKRSM